MRSSISAQSCASVPPAPGMQGHDRVAGVVLAPEHALQLEGGQRGLDRLGDLGSALRRRRRRRLPRRARRRPWRRPGVPLPPPRDEGIREPRRAPENGLRFLPVVPEIRRRGCGDRVAGSRPRDWRRQRCLPSVAIRSSRVATRSFSSLSSMRALPPGSIFHVAGGRCKPRRPRRRRRRTRMQASRPRSCTAQSGAARRSSPRPRSW